jgi:hypothetical protein
MSKPKVQIKSKTQMNKERVFVTQAFDIPLIFACLREVPPRGAKAGILTFEILFR